MFFSLNRCKGERSIVTVRKENFSNIHFVLGLRDPEVCLCDLPKLKKEKTTKPFLVTLLSGIPFVLKWLLQIRGLCHLSCVRIFCF